MTLVASFKLREIPVLVGDFLLTDDQVGIKHDHLSTIPELKETKSTLQRRRIAGLRKKIHKIGERLSFNRRCNYYKGEKNGFPYEDFGCGFSMCGIFACPLRLWRRRGWHYNRFGDLECVSGLGFGLVFGIDDQGFFIDANAAGEPELTISKLQVSGSVDAGGHLGRCGGDAGSVA